MSYDEFYSGGDWEQSSEPNIFRPFHLADLWPVGAAYGKDELESGLHPVVAIGTPTDAWDVYCRHNLTGVVTSYNAGTTIAVLNLADKAIVRNYVANVTFYNGGVTYAATFDIGAAVYVDDSSPLSSGVTLSLSPFNEDGAANPLAGYLYYCQDEFMDIGVGGPNEAMVWPKDADDSALVELPLCVMLVNDSGQGCLAAMWWWWPKQW
jgi:hypothetical protein